MASHEVNKSDQVTRGGRRVFYPRESALYSVNPCPPARFLPKKAFDYADSAGNGYWDAYKDERLSDWVCR